MLRRMGPIVLLLSTSLLYLACTKVPADASALEDASNGNDIYGIRHVNPDDVRFSPGEDLKEGILTALNEADQSIDIAMYSFSDRTIQAKVKELSESGVAVRLVLHKAQNSNSRLAAEMEAAGVDVRYIFPVMHHKFAIIDGGQAGLSSDSILITGSSNWSGSAFTKYDEDWLRFNGNGKVTRAYQIEFNAMWDHAMDYEGEATSAATVAVDLGNSPANVAFTSANFERNGRAGSYTYNEGTNNVADKIVAAIDSATRSIDVAHVHFRKRDIYEALKRAHERGVAVQIITDQQEFRGGRIDLSDAANNLYFEEHLASRGVPVRYKTYALAWDYRTTKQLHTKYLIIDKKWVITGSYNWSDNAEQGTFENVISIKRRNWVLKYQGHFNMAWGWGGDEAFRALLEEIEENGGTSPCVFDSQALTGDQIRQLRDQYADGACR